MVKENTVLSDNASLDNDVFDVMHYSTDKKGRTNWIRLGSAWSKPNSDRVRVKLFAYPLPNEDRVVMFDLVLKNEGYRESGDSDT